MQVVLVFVIVIAVVFILGRLDDHNNIKEVGGIDIIALGSDFDGIPTPLGMSDCTKTLALKEALVKEGYLQEEINKIFYLNFLRVFKEVCK